VGRKKERYDLDLIFRAANVCSVTLDPPYQVPPLDPQPVSRCAFPAWFREHGDGTRRRGVELRNPYVVRERPRNGARLGCLSLMHPLLVKLSSYSHLIGPVVAHTLLGLRGPVFYPAFNRGPVCGCRRGSRKIGCVGA